MEAENRPNAALINREWFESASGIMSQEELSMVVLNACRYVFGLPEVAMRNQSQHIVLAMIRPALDSDIAKYRERCARNAANARSGRERVAASGTQSQQVGAITTPTPTTTTTTTTTTTPSLSPDKQRQRERFVIYGYFWSVGSGDPMAEMNAFWDYYESLGWKNNKGAVIVSKQSAARMWRRQFETKTPPDGAQAWFRAVQMCKILDPTAFTIFAGSERVDEKIVVRLRCTDNYLSQLRENTPRLEADLRAFWRGLEPVFETAG